MRGRGKPAHVGADLRQDDLGAQFADPTDHAQLLDGVTKGSQPGIDLPINRGDAGIERHDLLQMEIEQGAMVSLDGQRPAFQRPRENSGIPGGTLSSSAGSTSSTVASLAIISSPG
jgi:hypothetical protein